MASIEMKNLGLFPIEKLCFDLKLEAMEQMEPRDVCELAKVNQGFQGMLVRDPSIVFGEHVYRIRLFYEMIRIKKFSNSNEMELNVDRPFFHFFFVKKIRSCDQLWQESSPIETLERFFSNFHASIKKEAELATYCRAFDDQMMNDWIENFMVGPQLKDCERVWLRCRSEDSVRFYYNALSKSQIKNVYMRIYSEACFRLMIQLISTNGIPSKNPDAAILLCLCGFCFSLNLSQYPGMRRIDGENRLQLCKQANYIVRNFGNFRYGVSDVIMEENSMFRRRFDSTKDCICVYDDRDTGYFLAFYVPVDGND